MATADHEKKIHIGRKIAGLRRIQLLSQETLAQRLKTTRQNIAKYENSEVIEAEKLKDIAEALGITVEGLENFNEDAGINNVGNQFHEGSNLINFNFNPIEKIMELSERLLNAEKEKYKLLEGIIQIKNEQITMLQKALDSKNEN